jgi:hypothetical protein
MNTILQTLNCSFKIQPQYEFVFNQITLHKYQEAIESILYLLLSFIILKIESICMNCPELMWWLPLLCFPLLLIQSFLQEATRP